MILTHYINGPCLWSLWMTRAYFLKVGTDVHVPNRVCFIQLNKAWEEDPCRRLARRVNGTWSFTVNGKDLVPTATIETWNCWKDRRYGNSIDNSANHWGFFNNGSWRDNGCRVWYPYGVWVPWIRVWLMLHNGWQRKIGHALGLHGTDVWKEAKQPMAT